MEQSDKQSIIRVLCLSFLLSQALPHFNRRKYLTIFTVTIIDVWAFLIDWLVCACVTGFNVTVVARLLNNYRMSLLHTKAENSFTLSVLLFSSSFSKHFLELFTFLRATLNTGSRKHRVRILCAASYRDKTLWTVGKFLFTPSHHCYRCSKIVPGWCSETHCSHILTTSVT